jgi:hypothetical protein
LRREACELARTSEAIEPVDERREDYGSATPARERGLGYPLHEPRSGEALGG